MAYTLMMNDVNENDKQICYVIDYFQQHFPFQNVINKLCYYDVKNNLK